MKCPVCDHEYVEEQDTICSCCKFPLRFHREDLRELTDWIKTIWMEKDQKDHTSPSSAAAEIEELRENLMQTIQRVNSLEESQSKYEQYETKINDLETQLLDKTNKVSADMEESLNTYQQKNQSELSTIKKQLLEKFEDEKTQSQQKFNDFDQRLKLIEGLCETNKTIISHYASEENSSANQERKTVENITHPKMEVNKEEYELAQQFNNHRKGLEDLKDLTEVSETVESFTTRRLGSSSSITFECKRRGTYLIINKEGKNYLVPNDNFRINQNNLKHLEEVFEFWNYQPEKDFKLIKPALVTIQSGEKTWQLEKPGILEFKTTSMDQSS